MLSSFAASHKGGTADGMTSGTATLEECCTAALPTKPMADALQPIEKFGSRRSVRRSTPACRSARYSGCVA